MTLFDSFFLDAPESVNVDGVRYHWQSLEPHYNVGDWMLPLPPWRHHGYSDSGHAAWNILQHDLSQVEPDKPFCIYLHTPFCSRKCNFCDSYSFKLGSHQTERIQDYVDRLCYELRLWSQQGNLSQRPVSTVHLGGGTPTFLGGAALRQITDCCRECFSVSPKTEWALESTVNELTPEITDVLHELGYRRLHIGIQTLEPQVRKTIGRLRHPVAALDVIERTLALDWVVSVDLICGLPYQTLTGFMDAIEILMDIGVNGFSIYELLVYPQNRRWCKQYGLTASSRHLFNYWMFVAGALLLESRGFAKNLFNHWADAQDTNIYFTFPIRGEDLLAVGTIADGVFGNYHYRHPSYARYMKHSQDGLPGLEGGLRRDTAFDMIQPFVKGIQASRISGQVVHEAKSNFPGMSALLDRWMTCSLINHNGSDGLKLTASGSWFAGNLIADLTAFLV